MGDFCIFKLELSNQNDNPDIPSIPNNRKLGSMRELLSLKYERYNVKYSQDKPVELIMSSSPLVSSPILLKINTYFSKK
jgi:hypothetical protein